MLELQNTWTPAVLPKRKVNLLLGIIEPLMPEWCNQLVLIPKKNGDIRICINLRFLNALSHFYSYPTPQIDDLGKAKYETTKDLCKGCWQVPLSQCYTHWQPSWGLFQITVLPFRLRGTQATFQRLVDRVLCSLSDLTKFYMLRHQAKNIITCLASAYYPLVQNSTLLK